MKRILPPRVACGRNTAHALFFVLFLLCRGMIATAGETETAQRVMLSHGVRLLLKPEAETPIVAITISIRMEPDTTLAEAAAGEIVSHALFGSTLNSSRETIAAAIAQVGGSLETLRAPDHVTITCIALPEQARQAAYLLSETLKNAEFTPEALERARQAILDERRKREANRFAFAYDMQRQNLQHSLLPDAVQLRHVTQEQALSYFRRRYTADRTVIAIVGHFDPRQMQTFFEGNLSDFERRSTPQRSLPQSLKSESKNTGSFQSTNPQTGAIENRNPKIEKAPPLRILSIASSAYALVVTSAPHAASPDYPAFTVLTALLGDGHASRLFRRVRDTQGFGYSVGALHQARLGDPMMVYLQWDTRRAASGVGGAASPVATADTALRLLHAQLDGVLADPPTEAEITRARNVAIGRDALQHERARDRAFYLAWYEAMGMEYTFDRDFSRRLAAVTREDVLRVARTYLSTRLAATVLPASE